METQNEDDLRMTNQARTPLRYNERITVGLRSNDDDEDDTPDIQLETVLEFVPSSVTPISIHEKLVQLQTFGAKRILIQTGSSPSQSIPSLEEEAYFWRNPDNTERTMGPSGVSVKVWFPYNDTPNNDEKVLASVEREHTFESILRYLHSQRIVVAPLESARQARLHRWVYTKTGKKERNLVELQLILPVQISPISSEGILAFTEALPCGRRSGILAGDVVAMSNRLLGNDDTPTTERRSTWIDIDFDTNDTNNLIRVHRGMQYSAAIPQKNGKTPKAVSLSDILPGHPTKPCPFSSSTVLETRHIDTSDGSIVSSHLEELNNHQDWSTILVPVSPSQKTVSGTNPKEHVVRFHRKVHRRHGIANSGTLLTILENRHPSVSMEVNLTDIFPNIVKPKWRTLRLEPLPSSSSPTMSWNDDGSTEMNLHTIINANSTLQVAVDYNPVFLAFEQFPGDPNRGVELPPSMATMRPLWDKNGQQQDCDDVSSSTTQQCVPHDNLPSFELVSNTLLLMPPVPDMSMPFNVNSLACTLYAFIFDTLLNMLVRKSTQKIQDKYKKAQEEKTSQETLPSSSDEPK